MKKLTMLLLALCMTVSLAVPASAAGPMEYTFDGTGDPEYGKDTSIEVVYTADGGAMKNEDVSKNAALAPPAFGSCSADTLHTGTPLTPNLAPGYQPTAGAVVNGSTAAIQPPDMSGSSVNGGNTSGSVYVPGSSSVTVTNPGSISSAIDGAASGVSGVAGNARSLTGDMAGITARMDTSQEIVGELQRQMDVFANL